VLRNQPGGFMAYRGGFQDDGISATCCMNGLGLMLQQVAQPTGERIAGPHPRKGESIGCCSSSALSIRLLFTSYSTTVRNICYWCE